MTVFTVVRNGRDTLSQTIAAVLGQSYPNIEYLVIDGASTDGTLEVVKQFADRIDWWLSEPDLGPTDAFNKAISHARGDFIFWLSSDDWVPRDYIGIAVEALARSGADFVFGNTNYYRNDVLEFTQLGDPDYARSIACEMPRLNPSSVVVKRTCFERIGLFDLRYKIACDYEWLRRLHFSGGTGVYEPRLNVCHRYGGVSDRRFAEGLEEVRVISVRGGASRIKASRAFWRSYLRRRARQLAEKCLPRNAYRYVLRLVRRNYSSG